MPNDRLVNIYKDPVRKHNLIRWLDRAPGYEPTALFVGEAPGKNGAAITGVPFCSIECLEMLDLEHQATFREDCRFEVAEGDDLPRYESTATAFWSTVKENFQNLTMPMAWNAVPFWPMRVVSTDTSVIGINRAPDAAERQFGAKWLSEIVEMYNYELIVALGRKAEYALRRIDVQFEHVRHPAHGGQTKFAAGVKHLMQGLDTLPKK